MGKQVKREFVQVLRLTEAFKISEVPAAVDDAVARGAIGFDPAIFPIACGYQDANDFDRLRT